MLWPHGTMDRMFYNAKSMRYSAGQFNMTSIISMVDMIYGAINSPDKYYEYISEINNNTTIDTNKTLNIGRASAAKKGYSK